MADTIALEAELLSAFKTVVTVFTAQDAVESCTLEIIRAITRQMTELFAIAALNRGIVEVLEEITRCLLLQL